MCTDITVGNPNSNPYSTFIEIYTFFVEFCSAANHLHDPYLVFVGNWKRFSSRGVTLQRAKSAREAIKVMTELVAEYGYINERSVIYDSGGIHELFPSSESSFGNN